MVAPTATEAFAGALDCPHYLFRWSPDSIQNPYQGILATADLLIVTSDTVSVTGDARIDGGIVL